MDKNKDKKIRNKDLYNKQYYEANREYIINRSKQNYYKRKEEEEAIIKKTLSIISSTNGRIHNSS